MFFCFVLIINNWKFSLKIVYENKKNSRLFEENTNFNCKIFNKYTQYDNNYE